jgi:hypothetical protein
MPLLSGESIWKRESSVLCDESLEFRSKLDAERRCLNTRDAGCKRHASSWGGGMRTRRLAWIAFAGGAFVGAALVFLCMAVMIPDIQRAVQYIAEEECRTKCECPDGVDLQDSWDE